jgi:DNA-binding transcriptional LysR family regulator
MDRLEAMSVLVAVAEAGSLSAASRRLGTPLATVSRKISELEERLETRLLNRSSRRMTLTDPGRSYVAACRRIIEQVDEAEREATGEYRMPKGRLAVTAPLVFGRRHVLPVATEFLQTYPDIDLRLVLTDHVLDLLEENLDLAIRIGNLPDSSLVATRVGTTRHVVCASPGYLATRGRVRKPEDLTGHDCITFEGLASPQGWTFGSGKAPRTVRVGARLSVTTAEAAIDAAIAGVGVTRVLSYMIEDATRAGLLDILLETFEPPPWPIQLVHAGQGALPLKRRAFLDWMVPRLRARLR